MGTSYGKKGLPSSLRSVFCYILVIDFLFPLLTIATLFLCVTKLNKAEVDDYTQICTLHHIQIGFYFSLIFGLLRLLCGRFMLHAWLKQRSRSHAMLSVYFGILKFIMLLITT